MYRSVHGGDLHICGYSPPAFTHAVVLRTEFECAVVIDVYLQAAHKECRFEVKQGLFRQHKRSRQLVPRSTSEKEALVCP